MPTYIVQGQAKPVRFTGLELARETTETESAMRWLELTLYRIDVGVRAKQYVLHRVGQSVVFHQPGGCGYGVATSSDNVPDDAEPCPVCHPEYGSLVELWMESPRHKVIICAKPADVEEALMMRRKDGSKFLSTPATNLIGKAVITDAALEEYFREVEDL